MDSVDKLINILKKFPTVGSRTAGRFVYYLMKLPKSSIDELIAGIIELRNKLAQREFDIAEIYRKLDSPNSSLVYYESVINN